MVGGSRFNDPFGGRGHKACVEFTYLASTMVGVEAYFNNLAYSSAETTIDCSKVLLAEATSAD